MSLTDFEIGKILGKGSFGNVCLVKRKFDGKTYAMKRIKIVQLSEKEKENSLNEIRILASLSHKNIIGYKDAFFDKKSKTLNVVMEFANDGDIYSKIKYNLKHDLFFKEEIIWDYLIQILEGLNYLHEKKIIHRDLKSANIFLMKDRTIKIGDLNVSKINKLGMAYTQTGTPYYASPEIWLDQPYDYKSDIWSLGCILYELCQLKPPFRGTSLKNLCMNIQNGIYNPIPDFYSNDLKNMISFMLQKDPNLRPSTKQILESDIIVKKIKELKINTKNNKGEERQGLIATIKVPRNLGEINKSLPKSKYNNKIVREEMLMEDEYETNKRKNGFLDEKDKKEIKNVYKNQNKDKNKMNCNNINQDNNNNNNNFYSYNNNINCNNMNYNQNNNNSDINYMNNNSKMNNNFDMNNNYMNYNHIVNNLVNNIKDNNNNYSFGERQVQNFSDDIGNVINNNVIFQNKDSYQNYQNNYYLNQQYLNNMNPNQIPIINNNFIDNSQNNFNINFNNNYNNVNENQQLMNKENYNANSNSNNYNNNFSFGENELNNHIHNSQNKKINNKIVKNKNSNISECKNKNSYSKDQIHNRNSINSNSNTPHYLNKKNIINKPRLSQGKGNHNYLMNHIDNLDKKKPSTIKNNSNKRNIIIKNNNYNKINNNNINHNNKYINNNEEENHYYIINNKKINNNQINERKKRAMSSKNPRINVISQNKNYGKNHINNISHNINYNNHLNKNNLKLNKNINNRSEMENKSKNFNMPISYNKQKLTNKVISGKEGIKNNSKNRQNKVHTPTPINNKILYPIMKKRNNKNVKIEKYIYPSKRKQSINNSYNARQNYIQQQATKNRMNKINNNVNINHNLKKRISHNNIETNKNNNSGVYNYRNYVKKDSSHLY